MIAIIAILASILFPVFARARENARRASCQSNLKQIGLGLAQYTQDYDERYSYVLPANLPGGQFANDWISWADVIQPYVKSTQIFVCPSNSTATTPPRSGGALSAMGNPATKFHYAPPVATGGTGGTYCLTMWAEYVNSYCPASTLSSIENSAQTLMIGDRTNSSDPYGGYAIGPSTDSTWQQFGTPSKIHLEGGNWLFADGHVKWLRPEAAEANNNYLFKRVKP